MISDYFNKYKDKGLTGLANIGNTCYVNSCLQILSHTYELNDFLDILEKNKINNNADSIILNEWNKLRTMMWTENCVIMPIGFIKAVHHISKVKDRGLFSGYAQNDVSEFLFFLIECFHNGIKREVDMTICGDGQSTVDKLAINCYTMMKDLYKKEYSEMLNIFYGISVTQILSKKEQEILSRKCEPYSVISLSIPNKNKTSLFECLDLYYSNEEMFDDNAWYNDETEQKEDVYKNIIFWSLPNILILDLKRFNNNNNKKNQYVDIPINSVDFSKYVAGYNKEQYIYDLYGIISHSGGVYGGHYTATVKNANGKWYLFNDRNINQIEEEKIITARAYCLFYRKRRIN